MWKKGCYIHHFSTPTSFTYVTFSLQVVVLEWFSCRILATKLFHTSTIVTS